ncbi:MAG: transposase [Rhodobacter sp.]|nr:transposase [Rhodobacter sp.]MCA3455823.1 transposase [Rhodobacter sp.]MCA3459834.1 transposase [Rhodobacter sp.]MCA3463549.1 transposase [Rhodobacter sp.]MCA3468239.1 transposase [Rhodobacter sp.]
MLIGTARPDVPACMGFPAARRTKPHPASPVKRLNREVKRRTGVVGLFPDETAITRLIRRKSNRSEDGSGEFPPLSSHNPSSQAIATS